MARKADKYPAIDPRAPRLYERIIEAAAAMRGVRQMESALGWAEVRAKRLESLRAIGKREAAEEPVPALTPSGVNSGPLVAVAASVD